MKKKILHYASKTPCYMWKINNRVIKLQEKYLRNVFIPFCLGLLVSVFPIPLGLKRLIPGLEELLFKSADCWNTSIVALAILSSKLFISATEPEP